MIETKSKAQILNDHQVNIQAPDGEEFTLVSSIGKYLHKEYNGKKEILLIIIVKLIIY